MPPNRRKRRKSLSDPEKREMNKEYSKDHDLHRCAHKFGVSTSTAGRIVGIYKDPVYNKNTPSAVRRRSKKTVETNGSLSVLKSYLDGIREGMVVRVAGVEEVEDSPYINGWDNCAETVLKKIEEFI